MYNGILPVYKEKGYTSFDVVVCLRKILNQKKIGHTGTLDPDACGVLPVCVGSATKIASLLTDSDKQYRATMLLGVKTDTQDISGKVLSESEDIPDADTVREALLSFIGTYEQTPPMFSALKVNGKKLYDFARQGIEVERKSRTVKINNIDIHSISERTAEFTVDCSKGTYIRTLIDDAGRILGCGACMKELLRTAAGGFTLEECHKLSDIERAATVSGVDDIIISTEKVFLKYPKLTMRRDFDRLLYNGNKLDKDMFSSGSIEESELYRVYDSSERFIGIYKKENDIFRIKYFFGE